MASDKIIFIPNIKKGAGTGHLLRSIHFVREGGDKASLFLNPDSSSYSEQEVRAKYGEDFNICSNPEEEGAVFVFDSRVTDASLRNRFASSGLTVSLDEGGSRKDFDYLIDTLPGRNFSHKANYFNPAFLKLPGRRKSPAVAAKRILLTFGGEDPAGLTQMTVSRLLKSGLFSPENITVVTGPLYSGSREFPDGVSILDAPDDLGAKLGGFDLIITSYGLTAFEAKASGTPVLLVNPEHYHRILGNNAGFISLGVKSLSLRRLKKYLADYSTNSMNTFNAAAYGHNSLVDYLDSLKISQPAVCPVCKSEKFTVLYRFRHRNYCKCKKCSTVFNRLIGRKISDYSESYFFEEYQKQYGKTYLEDFEKIMKLSQGRLAYINRVMKSSKKRAVSSLLDIGCAYGPFLKAASDAGFDVSGIDISEAAVDYVKNELGYTAECCDFSQDQYCLDGSHAAYDVITMWYVIEHFEDLNRTLKNVYARLNEGGVFAFSTPDLSGISGRKSLKAFLKQSPDDHTVVFSSSKIRRLMRKFGFRVVKIKSTGHHPERFRSYRAGSRFSLLQYSILMAVSKIFRLGDSFEVYAKKM